MGKGPYSFWGYWGHFWGQAVNLKVTRGQFWGSLEHNSKSFKVINLKLDTDTFLGSGKMPVYFGVTGVNIGVTGSILGSRPFPRDTSKSFTAIKLKPSIYLSHRLLRKPIHFGVVTLNFKVTEVTKVKFGFQSITPKVFELST